jgi:GNAT superfamily N-acetyltransferase
MIAAARALAERDLEAVLAVDGAAARPSRRGFYVKRFAAMAEDPGFGVALAAERAGELVGFAFARVLDGEFGGRAPSGVLDAIGVAPGVRGDGVGSLLVAELERALAARGARELRTQADWTEHGLVAFFGAAGFRLSGRVVLERALDAPAGDEFSWEELPVRSMQESDLPALVRLDRRITGLDRTAYYRRKAAEVLRHAGVRVSMVAEVERTFAGFLMARVDYGEFGRADPIAVLDTLGVDPDFARRRVGRALLEQLLLNLRSLRVERLLTVVEFGQLDLLAFFVRTGFAPSQRLSFTKAIG